MLFEIRLREMFTVYFYLKKNLFILLQTPFTSVYFVPLVETFGFWSPFALQTLRTIAECTTARTEWCINQTGS